MKTAIEVINPGVRQCDAVGEIQRAYFMELLNLVENISSIATCFQQEKEHQHLI